LHFTSRLGATIGSEEFLPTEIDCSTLNDNRGLKRQLPINNFISY
jgi:hypothetical protein